MSANAFLDALRSLSPEEQSEYAAKYSAWDPETRAAADQRVSYLRKGPTDRAAPLVAEEIEHGLEHTARTALLRTLRGWAETKIWDRLRDLTYTQHVDDAGVAAIKKFRAALDADEQQRVLRAFAIEMMDAFGGLLAHGPADRDCPVTWTLVNPATGRQVGGELHAEFDGDPEDVVDLMPRVRPAGT